MPDRKILLKESDIPKQWYNIVPDLPHPLPPFIDVETKQPGVGIVPRIFPREIIGQEISQERWINIPDEVRDVYKDQPRFSEPSDWKKHLKHQQKSTTNTKAQAQREATNPTPPCHRLITT